ncbi:diphthine--ammonia ligase [Candidatus Marsarchaeota archaeon]|jgi:ABC transporter with metal-binding/Fe-S-binding domain ATP-binding protein|nr:diphthine--ammonia ligase [Candidatus Marsarchaeota archaeon]MCL5092586.1 diphthine--ammonia ligase [Candidatus Marsarchaeota archaeon]
MIACLYSGGKDSTLALHKAYMMGIKAELLITMISKNEYSYMFHRPNVEFSGMQAKALGIRHLLVMTEGEKEKELDDIEIALNDNSVTRLITGAVASTYQRDRINRICERLGIEHISPLWGIDPMEELNELSSDYNAIITHVSAEGLDESFLGSRIDDMIIGRLVNLNKRYGINMLFEGGEAESFVLDAPLFKEKIIIDEARSEWDGSIGNYIIEKAHLEMK